LAEVRKEKKTNGTKPPTQGGKRKKWDKTRDEYIKRGPKRSEEGKNQHDETPAALNKHRKTKKTERLCRYAGCKKWRDRVIKKGKFPTGEVLKNGSSGGSRWRTPSTQGAHNGALNGQRLANQKKQIFLVPGKKLSSRNEARDEGRTKKNEQNGGGGVGWEKNRLPEIERVHG